MKKIKLFGLAQLLLAFLFVVACSKNNPMAPLTTGHAKHADAMQAQETNYTTYPAANYCDHYGGTVETCSEGGQDLGYIFNCNWAAYQVHCGDGVNQIIIRVASGASGGNIEIHQGSVEGPLLGNVQVSGTGGWQKWTSHTAALPWTTGDTTLYLVFHGGSGALFNLAWFGLSAVEYQTIASSVIQAESSNMYSAKQCETCSEGGTNVSWINPDAFLGFGSLDFGSGMNTFKVRVTAGSGGGVIEVHVDSPTGTLLGSLTVGYTGGWQSWTTQSTVITPVTGLKRIFLVFRGTENGLFNIHWITFANQNGASFQLNASSQIPASSSNIYSSLQTEPCSEGGWDVGWINNDDYLGFDSIDFGAGFNTFQARVATNTGGGTIEIHADDPTGTLLGTLNVGNTGGWQTWMTKEINISPVTGLKKIFLVFHGNGCGLFNIQRISFCNSIAVFGPNTTVSTSRGSTSHLVTSQISYTLDNHGIQCGVHLNGDGGWCEVDIHPNAGDLSTVNGIRFQFGPCQSSFMIDCRINGALVYSGPVPYTTKLIDWTLPLPGNVSPASIGGISFTFYDCPYIPPAGHDPVPMITGGNLHFDEMRFFNSAQ